MAAVKEMDTNRCDIEVPAKGMKVESAKEAMATSEVIRKILPAAVGSFLEFYEFGIYSYMAVYITGNFFADGHGGSLGTWAGFATTFIARPFGGAFFGWVGDRFGRVPAMRLTISIMLVTTLGQGLLPTFLSSGETAGWFGLVTMLLFRILQGMSAGGELTTAAVYITEVSPPEDLGWNLSWLSVIGSFGSWVVAALVVFVVETALGPEKMMAWGWRVPYITSLIPGVGIILARSYLQESPEFEKGRQADEAESESSVEAGVAPAVKVGVLTNLFKHNLPAVLVGGLGTAAFGVLCFVPPLYGVKYVRDYNGLSQNVVTFSEMVNYLVPTLLAPAVGLLIDRWGVGRTYTLAVFLGCVVAPIPLLYWWAHTAQGQGVATVFIGQFILGLGLALQTSVYLWTVELFPVQVRVTGVSVAYNIGLGLFGGMGPLISEAASEFIDPKGLVSAPALYTTIIGIISLAACIGSRAMAKRGTMRVTHIRDSPY